MSKINQPQIDLNQILNAIGDQEQPKYLLTRSDGMTKQSYDIKWIEFNEDGTFKKDHGHKHDIGLSLLMSPFNMFFTWQTTPVTEIISNDSNKLIFKTKNSIYTLTQIDEEPPV